MNVSLSMWRSGLALIGRHRVVFAALAVWALAPITLQIINVVRHGGVLTGAYGYDPYDQLAYLAWIRDSAGHWLASDLWSVAPTAHDYLQPMYFVSGLLVRIGVGVRLAYLLWIPVGVVLLFLGFAGYVERTVEGAGQRRAALILGLFYETPLVALALVSHALSPPHQLELTIVGNDSNSALNLWGFDQTAIAVGLMPVFLIAVELLLASPREGEPPSRRRRLIFLAAVAGALVSWLHPWQGATLLVAVGGLVLLRTPRRRYSVLVLPVVATVLPLAYGVLLARYDPIWSSFQTKTMGTGTQPWWALLAVFAPLGVFSALGLRRPRCDRELLVVLWIVATAAVYFVIPEFPPHALAGLPLPLAVLAVRGWERASGRASRRLPARLRDAPWIAVAGAAVAVAALTVPAAVNHASDERDQVTAPADGFVHQLIELPSGAAAAVSYLSARAERGAVLAPLGPSMSIPGLTGRRVYDGHLMWQPSSHGERAAEFFAPGTGPGARRALLSGSGIRFVVAGCGTPLSAAQLAPLARPVKRLGCATVFEVAPIG